jgi:hypothetical protein
MRLALTAAAGVAMALMLAWEHFNGGVVSHHFLARSDMPAISNWWGLLVIPALAWFLLGRMEKRGGDRRRLLIGFGSAFLFGAALSFFFTSGRQEWCGHMVMALPAVALFLPIYRAECVLGFVIGMTFVFGPVLPLVAALIFAAMGFIVYKSVRFIVRKVKA